jgi:hypothetical protein
MRCGIGQFGTKSLDSCLDVENGKLQANGENFVGIVHGNNVTITTGEREGGMSIRNFNLQRVNLESGGQLV